MSAHSEQHAQHITPLWIYLSVGATLLFLTVVTVAVAYVDLGPFNLVVAMTVATIKATLVILFFMHLLYDNKFFMFTFLMSILFVGVFITLTLFDTMRRGDVYEIRGQRVNKEAAFYANLRAQGNTPAHGEHSAGAAASTTPATATPAPAKADTTKAAPDSTKVGGHPTAPGDSSAGKH